MKLNSLPLSKGRDAAGHNITSWTRSRGHKRQDACIGIRTATTKSVKQEESDGTVLKKSNSLSRAKKDSNGGKFANRDFFLSVLDSSATKRDAKAYLQRFTPQSSKAVPPKPTKVEVPSHTSHNGVNLGRFYGPTRAVEESPKFIQHPEMGNVSPAMVAPLHLALVKLRAPQTMTNDVLDGIGRTLSQLAKLGLTSTVVVDCEDASSGTGMGKKSDWKTTVMEQTDRVVAAIDSHGQPGARKVDTVIGISEEDGDVPQSTMTLRGSTHVIYRKLLMTPLRRGVIPVIPAIGYSTTTQQAVAVNADDVVLALTREFVGFQEPPLPDEDPKLVSELLQALRNEVSLDRLIILDPVGGIPSTKSANLVHVFLNLEQEFAGVKEDLLATSSQQDLTEPPQAQQISDIASGNPFSKFVETEFGGLAPDTTESVSPELSTSKPNDNLVHLQNLELVRKVLALLPRSSSALLTSPEEAANSGKQSEVPFQAIGVGTRRKRNPLIHNLLTDKPAFSSSLPAGRIVSNPLPGVPAARPVSLVSPTTFIKKGMSVSIFPDPKQNPWQPPAPGSPSLALTDSRIDLPRLVHLINDSFNRTLDVEAYLKRVNNRVAGVIIAGEYEGGALLTWEMPPGVVDDGSEESRARMVPYLDKFAVLKRAQGAGGVADILFKSMIRDCFPEGVCWRSRRNNPVNKWYFERSRGTWKMPGTDWTMFWTTPGLNLEANRQRFKDYEGVCRSIEPTWADGKKVID